MDYLYAAMWFIVALLLVFRMGRENKVFYLVGGVFFLMSGWWLAEALTETAMFEGTWGIAFRVVMAVMLIVCCLVYLKERRKSLWRAAEEEAASEPDFLLEDGEVPEPPGTVSAEDALLRENAEASPTGSEEKRGEEN